MNKEELKIWFWDKFNSCYSVKHINYPDRIFYFYDKTLLREKKLCKINKQEIPLHTTNRHTTVSGVCLFCQYSKNAQFKCDYNKIWKFLEDNYSDDFINIQSLISSWLEDNEKLSVLIPVNWNRLRGTLLEDTSKLSIITNK